MGWWQRPICLVLAAVSACAPAANSAAPSPSAPPAAVITPDFGRYVGAYRSAAGALWITNASGHLLHLSDSSFRQLYPTATRDRFTVGPAFAVPAPVQAQVTFHVVGGRADRMTVMPVHGAAVSASRLPFKEADVRIPATGATLAATITEPLTAGPHPGIVIVHGSESGERFYYGIWVGFYASLGFTVLTYDKRGHGQSTGNYPGELATAEALNTLAGDAAAALGFIASWPGVDPARVGFHGGSQGGWTVPLAMGHDRAAAAFAVLLSGPAITVDQQGIWADYTASSTMAPSASLAEMEKAVRTAATSGYDPRPVLAELTVPMLWINGSADWQVPTAVNTEILRSFRRHNWEIMVLPDVDHGLFENSSGLVSGEAAATQLAPIWDPIATFLAREAGAGHS